MTLADFIKRYRNQTLAAKALGVSQGMLSKVVSRADYLSIRQALRIQSEHGIAAVTLISAADRALLESQTGGAGSVPADVEASP